MTDSRDNFDSLDEIEALVRSAGNYVWPSEDLRPCVLEAARVVRSEERARLRVLQMAACALMVGLFAVATFRHHESPTSHSPEGDQAIRLLSQAPTATHSGDSAWVMVDSFTDLRRRQAELFRLEL
jgi:hypothetical protein